MWSIRLKVDSPYAKSLASSLATEHDVEFSGNELILELMEPRARDLRAMWNTRMRSIVIANRVVEVMDSLAPME